MFKKETHVYLLFKIFKVKFRRKCKIHIKYIVHIKLFVLFLILTFYSVKQKVSVSLFSPNNIMLLLGNPLSKKISLVKGKNREGEPKFATPRVESFEGGMENSSYR